MNDGIATVTGKIWYHGVDINEPDVNIYEIRRHWDGLPAANRLLSQFVRTLCMHYGPTGLRKAELNERVEQSCVGPLCGMS